MEYIILSYTIHKTHYKIVKIWFCSSFFASSIKIILSFAVWICKARIFRRVNGKRNHFHYIYDYSIRLILHPEISYIILSFTISRSFNFAMNDFLFIDSIFWWAKCWIKQLLITRRPDQNLQNGNLQWMQWFQGHILCQRLCQHECT